MAAAVTNARLDAGVFAAYLLAARETLLEASSASVPPPASTPASDVPLPTLQAIQRVAAKRQLDPDVLQRWVTALAEPATRQPTHPLYAWVTLALKNPAAEGSAFAAQAERLRIELTSQAERAAAAAQQTVLFADFNQGHLDGWFVTGEAFDAAPTRAGQWDAAARKDEFVPAGVAHSGLTLTRLRGVLRSPTFTLTHPQIHYRLCAKDVQVRLVIDGYFMTIFHSLLFNGVALSQVDTGGQFRWQTQGGDLQNYLGHRAYIEIVDHGDGWAAVDEIRFAHGGPPPDPPHPDNLQVLSGPRIESPEALAGVYGSAWDASLARWRKGASESGDTDLLNWALQHRLVSTETLTASVADKIADIERALPEPTFVLAIADGTGQDGHVNVRGNAANPGDLVPRRFLAAIAGDQQPPIGHGSGRLELARHLTDPANPFPARVLVNRLWHHLFGRGIAPSVDDFGAMGQGPTHPQLLDWLARDFQDHGWSVKRTFRQIVLSSTYRMSSQPGSAGMRAEQADPANELFHRMPVRRLPAESIRDALLAVSGRLDPTLYGPSVPVHLTPFMEGRGRPGSGPLDGNGRRSVYVEVRRNFLAPMMLAFDAPSPFSTMGRRSVSNVPAQSLILMNDPFVVGQARHWAEGLLSRSATADERIAALFQTALAHPPSDAQRERIHGFLDQQSGLYGAGVNDLRVWTDVCHMILNMKEFVFLN